MSLRRPELDALAWNADGLVPVVVQEVASGAVLMLAWADRAALARTLERGEGWFWSRSRRRLWRKGETSGHTLAVAEVAVDCDGDAVLYRVDATGPTCHTGARSCFEEGREGRQRTASASSTGAVPVAGAKERIDEEVGELPRVEWPRVMEAGAARRLGEDVGGPAGGSERDSDVDRQPAPSREDASTGVRSSAALAQREAPLGEEERASEAGVFEGAAPSAARSDRPALAGPRLELGWLWDVLAERAAADSAESYTARLLAAGIDRIARKVGEEATEVVIAALRAAPASHPTAGARLRPPAEGVSVTSTTAGAGTAPSGTEPAPSVASPLAAEAADLLYHLLVLLLAADVPPEEVAAELRRRHARPVTPASPKPEGAPANSARSPVAPPPEGRR